MVLLTATGVVAWCTGRTTLAATGFSRWPSPPEAWWRSPRYRDRSSSMSAIWGPCGSWWRFQCGSPSSGPPERWWWLWQPGGGAVRLRLMVVRGRARAGLVGRQHRLVGRSVAGSSVVGAEPDGRDHPDPGRMVGGAGHGCGDQRCSCGGSPWPVPPAGRRARGPPNISPSRPVWPTCWSPVGSTRGRTPRSPTPRSVGPPLAGPLWSLLFPGVVHRRAHDW